MKQALKYLTLAIVLVSCMQDQPPAKETYPPSISINIVDDKFHGSLEYTDSLGLVRVAQEWSRGSINGYTKVFNRHGLLEYESMGGHNMSIQVYGDETTILGDIIPRELGNSIWKTRPLNSLTAFRLLPHFSSGL